MSDTTFVDQTGPGVPAAWFNDVNQATYRAAVPVATDTGTVNIIIANTGTRVAAATNGTVQVIVKMAFTNTSTAPNLFLNGSPGFAVVNQKGGTLNVGDLVQNYYYLFVFNLTQAVWQVIGTVPSALALSGNVSIGGTLQVTGGTTLGVVTGGLYNGVNLSVPTQSVIAPTGAFSTVETYVSPANFSILNGMVAGQAYRITIIGTCTSSVANSVTYKLKYGATGTVADATIYTQGLNSAAAGTNVSFRISYDVVVLSVSGAGTAQVALTIVNGGSGSGILQTLQAVTVTATSSAFADNVTGILGATLTTAAGTTTINSLCAFAEIVR